MNREKIDWKRVRAVCIVKTMAKAGHFPCKENTKEAWFRSPFRPETHASFKVSKVKNLWFDHGAGFGGNVLDLVVRFYDCRILDALHFLSDIPSSFSFHPQHFVPPENTSLIVKSVNSIWHYGLKTYLNERNVKLETAKKYCKEVHYSCKGNHYFGIGLQNDSGGWELRNQYFKSSSSPKDSTFLSNGCSQLVVTEGMFDFLTVTNFCHDNKSFLILNSLSFIKKAMPFIEFFKDVELYLDNDTAGKDATNWLMQNHKYCKDKSYLYKDFKDINEMYIARKDKTKYSDENPSE
ncbi:toprim domain-containing protein [Maribacter sp. ACAM166]|uniref:toprim domain-containing protein n=1 Tax=Maribacter sp. ACAM166 TaxID=2508996 RepID=UPI0010FD69D5|nr:toprim domain-containing protein [Maribacter sp. ACAM166]TLP77568.1 toprim domain-containing protein [Maribacter sp. ACAM166]